MRNTLLLFATLFGALFAAIPALHGEDPVPVSGDNFTIQSNFSEPLRGTLPIGAFRVMNGGQWIAGGGLASPVEWGAWADAKLLADGMALTFEEGTWQQSQITLPEQVAYAAVAAGPEQSILLAGGLREEGISSRVSKWTYADGGWITQALPPLPRPLAFSGAHVMDGVLYVAGGTGPAGDNAQLYALSMEDPEAAWTSEELTGTALPILQPMVEFRKDEVAIKNALYVFGGWTTDTNNPAGWTPNVAGFKYISGDGRHAGLTRIKDAPTGNLIIDSSALGPAHIVASAVPASALNTFPALIPYQEYPPAGFLRYHVFTDTWAAFSTAMDGPVTRIDWTEKKQLFFSKLNPDGKEVVHEAEILASERHFSFFDYLVMVLYMFGLVAIGKYFASRERNTEDFFLGGRKVPWWAAGLSIYATGTSAISFMAIPAKTYATDWLYFIGMSIFPFFTVLIAAYVFIPMLRRLELTTVMEYFELRFGRPVRLLLSAIAVLGQVAGRMSITLLLPSIALTAVTGMNIYVCILVMGVLATIYTAVGGINAVIWTDVLQVFVLFGGAILSLVLVVIHVDGGAGAVFSLALQDDKFHLLDGSWDFTTATIWVMVLWAVSDVFGKGLGQEGLQRAFSTKGVKEARRSMITCAVVALPAGFLFYGIGTALYAFYHANPQMLNPTLQTDAIFPLFIAQQLPVGIAGLVISGLFAASMSTLDTAMNTSATIVVRDFYSIWHKDTPDHKRLVMAKIVTVVCGVLGTGIALYMASFKNLGSLWDMFGILLGVIGGGLGGVGVLALCTTRANTWGTLAGAAVTAVCIIYIQRYTPVHFFIYGTLSMAIGGTTGYLFSLVIPAEKKDLTGLTLWTPAPKE